MDDRGVIYIAIGDKAQYEAAASKVELDRHDEIESKTIIENPYPKMTPKQASRAIKVHLFDYSPWQSTCYLDADTRPATSIMSGFDILEDGFDLVITHSDNQGEEAFWHIGEPERTATFRRIANDEPLQLQAGVFWIRKNIDTEAFMKNWIVEWMAYQDEDQAAFIRALHASPIKVWVLGRPWNGGALINHRWGALR